MSAAEQAIDKLRQVRERLPPEERSPDLDDLLATFEAYSAARAELLAARGATPPPGQQWGANAVERHPQLFRGLLHLLSAVVGAADVPLATAVTPELQSLLVGSALHVSLSETPGLDVRCCCCPRPACNALSGQRRAALLCGPPSVLACCPPTQHPPCAARSRWPPARLGPPRAQERSGSCRLLAALMPRCPA